MTGGGGVVPVTIFWPATLPLPTIDGGGVLHCSQEAGVVFQSTTSLALNGWRIEGAYRFAE